MRASMCFTTELHLQLWPYSSWQVSTLSPVFLHAIAWTLGMFYSPSDTPEAQLEQLSLTKREGTMKWA
jgi:hypothetical protein